MTKKMRMRLKERGRYTVVDPDAPTETKKEGEEESEYTDGFYSSDSDNFVPNDTTV